MSICRIDSAFSVSIMIRKKEANFSFLFSVSKMRLELTQPNGHYPLKVARLPIPPPRHSLRLLPWGFREVCLPNCDAKLVYFPGLCKFFKAFFVNL